VTEESRTLHNEDVHNLYSSSSIIRMVKSRRIRWAGHVARIEENRNSYRILVRKPEGNRPLPPHHCVYDAVGLIRAQVEGHVARSNTLPSLSQPKR
jgi:hypothetical protein